jgi:hypothetical protein
MWSQIEGKYSLDDLFFATSNGPWGHDCLVCPLARSVALRECFLEVHHVLAVGLVYSRGKRRLTGCDFTIQVTVCA